MNKIVIVFVGLLLANVGYNQGLNNNENSKPKLIVLIAVDGLRGDLIDKYGKAFTGGFLRLKNEGYQFTNAWVDHAITVSHAGHVTLATGNFPRTHGIVDAAFYEKGKDRYEFTDAFQDTNYNITGYRAKSISPKKVLTTGLAEWAKENDANSRSLSVGTGNISSALYNFRPNNEVYWLAPGSARYVSSTFYLQKYPDWFIAFHKNEMPSIVKRATNWDLSVPAPYIHLANRDDEPYEAGGSNNVFPHTMQKELPEQYAKDSLTGPQIWFGNTPYADVATLALAKAGIEALQLGKRNSTDFLSIVVSQVDNNSHFYGPSSLETFDALVKIDQALGDFLSYLDKTVGKENYTLALSSDHGFPEVPEQTSKQGKWSNRISEQEVNAVMEDLNKIISNGGTETENQNNMKSKLKSLEFVADVYTDRQLADKKNSGDPYLELYKKSFRSDRIPRLPFFSLKDFHSVIAEHGLMVRLKDNAIMDLDIDIHGSAYDHDRFVPLYFFGAGIKKGNSNKKVATVDVAPSLAKIASLKFPQTDGHPLF